MNGMRRELTNRKTVSSTKDDQGVVSTVLLNVPHLRDHRVNYGIIESALDEVLYRPRFPPAAFIPAAGAVLGPFYMAFPKAGTPRMGMGIPSPAFYWTTGTFTVKILWTGDTASTNPVEWAYNMFITPVGGVPTAIVGPTMDVAGPSVIGAIISSTFTTSVFAVDSSMVYVLISLLRNSGAAGDTYTGEARILGVQLIYTPSAGH
jgi:hypothetical protein